MYTKDYIEYVVYLIEEIQRSAKRPGMFRWCEEQKQYWKKEYAKLS